MTHAIDCPTCGASLPVPRKGAASSCPYCGKDLAIPDELFSDAPDGACIPPEKVNDIIRLIRAKQKILAIKKLSDITGLGLQDAKDVVDSVERSFHSGGIPGEAEALLHQVAIVPITRLAAMEEEEVPPDDSSKMLTTIAVVSVLFIVLVFVMMILLK